MKGRDKTVVGVEYREETNLVQEQAYGALVNFIIKWSSGEGKINRAQRCPPNYVRIKGQ